MQLVDKSERKNTLKPFLKWTGGKRWLVPTLRQVIPESFNRYFEPFLGGGAAYFSILPHPATLSDVNEDLINVYVQIRDNVDEIIERLSRLTISESKYLELRSRQCCKPVTRAVRFLYLNRTAFNGIYRVNQQGLFNVPYGCKPGTVLCDSSTLTAASRALQNRTLRVCDFESALDESAAGDLVYVDPPYTNKHDNNGFRRYNETIFGWTDQERLAGSCVEAVRRGVSVIVSNADHRPVVELYTGFNKLLVERVSVISGKRKGRGYVKEVLLTGNLSCETKQIRRS